MKIKYDFNHDSAYFHGTYISHNLGIIVECFGISINIFSLNGGELIRDAHRRYSIISTYNPRNMEHELTINGEPLKRATEEELAVLELL